MAKSKKDKYKAIFSNIDKAYESHQIDEWKGRCQRILGYVNGDWGRSGEDNKYVINTLYNLINLITPNLFYQAPWIRVSPTKKYIVREDEEGGYRTIEAGRAAQLFEHIINDTLAKIDLEEEWRKCVHDSLIYGIGVLKLGFNPSPAQSEANVDTIRPDEVFAQRICPFDFGWDPMASTTEDARFLIHRVVRTLDEIQNDDNLSNTDELKGMDLSEETPKASKKEDSKDDGDWVELYEYHDQVNGMIYTVAKQPGESEKGEKSVKKSKKSYKVLWERKNPHKDIKCHFAMLKFTGDNDKFVAPPMLAMVEDECLASNELLSLMVNHFRMFPGMIIHEHGAVDDDEIDAFEAGEQGAILQVQSGALQNGRIQRTPPMPMGAEYFSGLATLGGLMDKILGVPDFQRQGSTKRKTATEVSTEAQDSTIRRSYFLNFVKRFIIKTVKKVSYLVQQYYDEKRDIRITGEFDEFWTWDKYDIAGEWGFDFDVESMRVFSASRAQGIINMLNVTAQYPVLQPIQALFDPEEIAEELCKNLDVNFEAIKKKRTISHIEYDPNEENRFAAEGKRIPDPKPGEPHSLHLGIHQQAYQEELGKGNQLGAMELERHMQMTQFLMQVQGIMPGSPAQSPSPQGMPGAIGGPAPANGAQTSMAGPGEAMGMMAGMMPQGNPEETV